MFLVELIGWYNHEQTEKTTHLLIAIAIFIVVLLEIHPFKDGNGRSSLVLTTLLLLKTGYAYVPYSSLESVIEQNKRAYYFALR
jgi:Fic family protein